MKRRNNNLRNNVRSNLSRRKKEKKQMEKIIIQPQYIAHRKKKKEEKKYVTVNKLKPKFHLYILKAFSFWIWSLFYFFRSVIMFFSMLLSSSNLSQNLKITKLRSEWVYNYRVSLLTCLSCCSKSPPRFWLYLKMVHSYFNDCYYVVV